MGALLCSHMSNQMIDMDLVDDFVMAIPEDAWDKVKDKFIELFVDSMPYDIVEQLTGDHQGFDKAETILSEYYAPDIQRIEIIIDAFRIIGPEQTAYALDLLGIVPEGKEEDTIEADLGALT